MPKEPLARLLIVDDEEAQMKALCNTLREKGYATTGFSTGGLALQALHSASYDLLLTDLMMPEMNGIELLGLALKLDPNLVGIVMTGQGTIDTAVQAMKAGALDYILKPFTLSAVMPVLARALAVRDLRIENLALQRRVRERTAELEAVNQELEAFSYTVSHDLRAPLRHIKAFLQLLGQEIDGTLTVDARQFLEKVFSAADSMDVLINNLLEFARMGRTELHREEFQTDELVREVLQEMERDLAGKEIQWEIEPLPQVSADRAMLKQVWTNLLSNAVKYSRLRTPPRIHIGWRAKGTDLEFFVRDNGAGFDMQYADRLFGVFQRLHPKEDFEGTGVGLANVHRIVSRHGGRTRAEAKVNEGATFYFTLPESEKC